MKFDNETSIIQQKIVSFRRFGNGNYEFSWSWKRPVIDVGCGGGHL